MLKSYNFMITFNPSIILYSWKSIFLHTFTNKFSNQANPKNKLINSSLLFMILYWIDEFNQEFKIAHLNGFSPLENASTQRRVQRGFLQFFISIFNPNQIASSIFFKTSSTSGYSMEDYIGAKNHIFYFACFKLR